MVRNPPDGSICSTCWNLASHWTADLKEGRLETTAWCVKCWDVAGRTGRVHLDEVSENEWITLQNVKIVMEE